MKKIGLPKNSFMKTTASILVLLIGIVPLCGCYDNRDIEDTAYAIAVGVDKDENTGSLIFSFQFTNPEKIQTRKIQVQKKVKQKISQ